MVKVLFLLILKIIFSNRSKVPSLRLNHEETHQFSEEKYHLKLFFTIKKEYCLLKRKKKVQKKSFYYNEMKKYNFSVRIKIRLMKKNISDGIVSFTCIPNLEK